MVPGGGAPRLLGRGLNMGHILAKSAESGQLSMSGTFDGERRTPILVEGSKFLHRGKNRSKNGVKKIGRIQRPKIQLSLHQLPFWGHQNLPMSRTPQRGGGLRHPGAVPKVCSRLPPGLKLQSATGFFFGGGKVNVTSWFDCQSPLFKTGVGQFRILLRRLSSILGLSRIPPKRGSYFEFWHAVQIEVKVKFFLGEIRTLAAFIFTETM